MADFKVEIVRIVEPVTDHPNADRLSLVPVFGFTCISAKYDNGSHRYTQDDLVAYIPEGAVMPEWLLKSMGFWREDRNMGMLSGASGNRTRAVRLRGTFSQGILVPVHTIWSHDGATDFPVLLSWIVGENDTTLIVEEGADVAEFLGITKFEPKVPQNMVGVMGALYNVTLKYDFDSIQKKQELFTPDEEVIATEKIHGTCVQFGYVPGLYEEGGDVYVTSKGIGARGFNLKDVPENDDNLYVRMLRKLREDGVIDGMKRLSEGFGNAPVRLFGEIFGTGIQDLGYGQAEPTFLAFDIMVGDRYLLPDAFFMAASDFGIGAAPILYCGPYDVDALMVHRDGKTTIGGDHIREGIVIRSVGPDFNPSHGRKIAKMVSPAYLLRKGENITEYA